MVLGVLGYLVFWTASQEFDPSNLKDIGVRFSVGTNSTSNIIFNFTVSAVDVEVSELNFCGFGF